LENEIPFWKRRYKPIPALRDRNEYMREYYLNNDKIDASSPRDQTGPRSSFLGKVEQMRDEN